MRKRKNPTGDTDIFPWLLGGFSLVAAVIFFSRRSQGSTAPDTFVIPTIPLIPLAPLAPLNPGAAIPTIPDARLAEIVARLRSSETARQIFAFQAMMYSWRAFDWLPDSWDGPNTQTMTRTVNTRPGVVNPSSTFRPAVLDLANTYLTNREIEVTPRMIYKLPADVIHLVNATMLRNVPGGPLLQSLPL